MVKTLKTVPSFTAETKLKVVVAENPKIKKSKEVFAIYKTGMTVGDFAKAYAELQKKQGALALKSKPADHISWDFARGYIDFVATK